MPALPKHMSFQHHERFPDLSWLNTPLLWVPHTATAACFASHCCCCVCVCVPLWQCLLPVAMMGAVFLSVFKWEARKGWKDLVTGFCDAFKPTDNVVLWILTKPFMQSGEVRRSERECVREKTGRGGEAVLACD